MSNVVAFKKVQPVAPVKGAPKSMTLFIHIKRATMIAHCGNLDGAKTAEQTYAGKSSI